MFCIQNLNSQQQRNTSALLQWILAIALKIYPLGTMTQQQENVKRLCTQAAEEMLTDSSVKSSVKDNAVDLEEEVRSSILNNFR